MIIIINDNNNNNNNNNKDLINCKNLQSQHNAE